MTEPTIKLGDLARDTITGYRGIVVARTEWLNGCWRYTLQARELKDGKPIDSQVFDVEQLELVTGRGHVAKKHTGGPWPDPVRHPAPVR